MKKTFFYATPDIPANLLVIQNDSFEPEQHCIIVMPGAGERLRNNFATPKLQLEAIDRRVITQMTPKADELKFNIVALGPEYEYTKAEILGAIKYAKEVLQSKYVSVLDHSLGYFGLANQMAPEIANQIDGAVHVAGGPGKNSHTFKDIAAAGFANWFVVSALDTITAGDLGKVATEAHNAIKAAGGNSFLTLFGKTAISNNHSILSSVLGNVNIWGITGNMGIFEFLLSNARGLPIVPPNGTFKAVAEKPVELPPIEPPVELPDVDLPEIDKTVTIHSSYTNLHEKGNKIKHWWTDDSPVDITLEEYPISGIYSVVDKEGPFKGLTRLSVVYVGTKKAKGIGPYKGMVTVQENG